MYLMWENTYTHNSYCPAKNPVCRQCHKSQHYQVMCRSSNTGNIQQIVDDYDNFFLGAVVENPKRSSNHRAWAVTVTLKVNDTLSQSTFT